MYCNTSSAMDTLWPLKDSFRELRCAETLYRTGSLVWPQGSPMLESTILLVSVQINQSIGLFGGVLRCSRCARSTTIESVGQRNEPIGGRRYRLR